MGTRARIVGGLVLLGVIIGCWRYLGQGSDLTSPDWFAQTTDTLRSFGDWVSDRIREATS